MLTHNYFTFYVRLFDKITHFMYVFFVKTPHFMYDFLLHGLCR